MTAVPITAATRLKFRLLLALFCVLALVQLSLSFQNFCHDGAIGVGVLLWLFLGIQIKAILDVYTDSSVSAPERANKLNQVIGMWWHAGGPFMWVLAYLLAISLMLDLNGRYIESPVRLPSGGYVQIQRTDKVTGLSLQYPVGYCQTHTFVNEIKGRFFPHPAVTGH
jgi:hypothetical protein